MRAAQHHPLRRAEDKAQPSWGTSQRNDFIEARLIGISGGEKFRVRAGTEKLMYDPDRRVSWKEVLAILCERGVLSCSPEADRPEAYTKISNRQFRRSFGAGFSASVNYLVQEAIDQERAKIDLSDATTFRREVLRALREATRDYKRERREFAAQDYRPRLEGFAEFMAAHWAERRLERVSAKALEQVTRAQILAAVNYFQKVLGRRPNGDYVQFLTCVVMDLVREREEGQSPTD